MTLNRHQILDRRSLVLANLVADKLETNPELLNLGLSNLDRWIQQSEGHIAPAHREWKHILSHQSLSEVLDLLRDHTEEACRLRQSNPFAGLLTPRERWHVLNEYDAKPA